MMEEHLMTVMVGFLSPFDLISATLLFKSNLCLKDVRKNIKVSFHETQTKFAYPFAFIHISFVPHQYFVNIV